MARLAGNGINIGGIYADLELDSGHLERGIANARRALDAIGAEVQRLQRDFNQGALGIAEYTARLAALNQTEQQLVAAMNAAYAATQQLGHGLGIVNQGLAGAGGASGHAARAMMQLGYIFDDIQYGFQGIVNNIAPFTYSIAAAAGASTAAASGIAAGFQIVAVAAYQLYEHWDQFEELLGISKVRTEAEDMEYLAGKTHRTADEQERLNKLKREAKEIDQLNGLRPDADEKSEKAVLDLFGEGPVAAIKGAVIAARKAGGGGAVLDPDEELKIVNEALEKEAGIWGKLGLESAADDAKAAQALDRARDAEDERRATDLLNRAARGGPEGDNARSELQALAAKNPTLFPAGFANQLDWASPEGMEAQQGIKEADAAEKEREKNRKKHEQDIDNESDYYDGLDAANLQAYHAGKRKRAERLKREAKERFPELDEAAENLVAQGRVMDLKGIGHRSPGDVIRDLLKARGFSDRDTGDIADDAMKGAQKSIGDKVARGVFSGRDAHSQIFSAEDLANRVQGAVTGDPMDKTNSLIEELVREAKEANKKKGKEFTLNYK